MSPRRRRQGANWRSFPRFWAGVIAIAVIAFAFYFAFTKDNPFSQPYELTAAFKSANNIKTGSPVRIAGVEVGKVTGVEPVDRPGGAARLTMEIRDKGLPIHSDAQLKIRPRIFLEGNFFVDLKPGSPSAPVRDDGGDQIPVTQTAAPVQLGDVLTALQSDTRSDLQVFLKEYSKGLEGKGAAGLNQSLRYGPEAFRSTALVTDAALGLEPTRDIQRVLKGQAKTFAALNTDENALRSLVTDFNITAAAFAREDAALAASIPALRDTLRVGYPALASLNGSLPSLRAFAVDALPGVRSTAPTLQASLPFIRQARLLVGPDELRATARQLRRQTPSLVRVNSALVPFLSQARSLSSCANNVLIPFANSPIPNPDEEGNTDQNPIQQASRGLVGLAGESRATDGNGSWFRTSAVPPALNVRPASPPDGGSQPPPRRPDVACETQEPPNLNAPGGPLSDFLLGGQSLPGPNTFDVPLLRRAGRELREYNAGAGARRQARYDAAQRREARGR